MEFQEVVRRRYSVRAYRPDPVDDDALSRILEAIRLAPTASNRQPIGVVVVPVRGRESELRRVYDRDWFVEAPLVIAVCAIPDEAWTRQTDGWSAADTDVAIAMTHLLLAAADEGLGTCWIASFDPDGAREVLGLPDGVVPVAFTPLGRPADEPESKERKALEVLVHRDRW